MRKAVKLRPLTTEEEAEIRRIAASRKGPFRLVQRAKVIIAMLDDAKLHATQEVSKLASKAGKWVLLGSSGLAQKG